VYRAGRDNHTVGLEGTTGQRGGDVVHRPGKLHQGLQVRRFLAGFQKKRLFARPAEDQMDFDFRLAQLFQQSKSVNRSAGSGDPDSYSQISPNNTCFVPNSERVRINLIEAGTDRKL
jgi:hypothetical protein